MRTQAQTERDGLITFQIFNIIYSDGNLNHNQNVKQRVNSHNFIISHWYQSHHLEELKHEKDSQAAGDGKRPQNADSGGVLPQSEIVPLSCQQILGYQKFPMLQNYPVPTL